MENKPHTIYKNMIHIGSWKHHKPNEIMLLIGSINYTEIYFVNGQKTDGYQYDELKGKIEEALKK